MGDSQDLARDAATTLGAEFETFTPDAVPENAGSRNNHTQNGRRIGPYRIRRLIAQGGMGAVYLAEREDDFQQRVALKLIHPRKANLEIMSRFYAERQILAGLEHPGIARIFDGGGADDDLPYFVMEYVEGEPIDRACRDLPLRRRLELFLEVCEAVQAAHQALVVHRDLKPSNILVTPEGRPKLLDFGIAGPPQAETSEEERSERKYMTPAYASPEQIRGEATTTSDDLYALGVLLYLLLTDRSPYELPEHPTTEDYARAVCEQIPAAPSLAAPKLRRSLEGDLDAVALKALAKTPEARYAAAAELAEEIRRHFDDLPVKAHRGSWIYRTRKAVRRHKLAAAGLLVAVTFGASSTGLWRHAVFQQQVAEEAREIAEQRREQAETVSDFLAEIFRSADPDRTRGEEVTLLDALESGREKLEVRLLDEPDVRADLLGTLGGVYNNLGFLDQALDLKQEAVRMRRAGDPDDRRGLAVDLNNLGRIYYDHGDHDAAEKTFREALTVWRSIPDVKNEMLTLRNLAGVLAHHGRGPEAAEVYRHLLALERSTYGDEEEKSASTYYGLATNFRLMDESADAEPLLRKALKIYERTDAPPRRVASVRSSLAQTLLALGRPAEARELLQQALEDQRRLFGEQDLRTASSQKNLAAVLLALSEPEEARRLSEEAMSTLQENLSETHWRTIEARGLYALSLSATGQGVRGDGLLIESLAALDQYEEAYPRLALRMIQRTRTLMSSGTTPAH